MYKFTNNDDTSPGELAFAESGIVNDGIAYVPGPHAVSLSGQIREIARYVDSDMGRLAEAETLYSRLFVLSITGAT